MCTMVILYAYRLRVMNLNRRAIWLIVMFLVHNNTTCYVLKMKPKKFLGTAAKHP